MDKKNSLSRYLYYNCKDIVNQDSNGNVIDGVRLDADDYNKNKITILRFKNGYLDGDVFNQDGSFNMQLPAVEAVGHQEYWRNNKLHRDNGLPAIISGNEKEYWVNGIRVAQPEEEKM